LIRNKITMARDRSGLNSLRLEILSYYAKNNLNDNELKNALFYLSKNPLQIFPNHFPVKYEKKNIHVFRDNSNGLPYVIFDSKRLYFPEDMQTVGVREYYRSLLIEQDDKSPHRYLSDGFRVTPRDVVADIGAAEGIFSLMVVEQASKLYIFEASERWITPLKATFQPWKSKVEIILKKVGDSDDDSHISLDNFCNFQKVKFDFLKIDVDGNEKKLLEGADELLQKNKGLKLAICTYHRQDDDREFLEFFASNNFKTCPSSGYMVFYHDPQIGPPYFRRGLLRVESIN
jgi:hypothetical protein